MSISYLSVTFPLSECSQNVCWETLLGLLSCSSQAWLPVLSLCELSCTGAPGSNTRHTWHRPCLQISWLEANFHPLLKIKSRHVSAILVFYCTSCQCVFSPPGAKTLKLPLRPDRQTAWEGSEGSRVRGRWVYQSGGPICREINC